MRLEHPIDDLFTTPSHAKVLRALATMPEGMTASVREIARRARVSHPAASRALDSLRRQGVTRVQRSPASDAYFLQQGHEAVPALLELFAWERTVKATLVGYLRGEIRSQAAWVSEAYLFGSAARGDMAAESDIDIACICSPPRVDDIERLISELDDVIAARFGNHLSLLVGTRPVATMVRLGGNAAPLWRHVMTDGINLLVGPTG